MNREKMKKAGDLKSLRDRASKSQKIASVSTPKPVSVGVESQSKNQSNPPSNGMQSVPVEAEICSPITQDDDSDAEYEATHDESTDEDDESIASNTKQCWARAEAQYISRLTYSVESLRFLLKQGLAFPRCDESECSNNRGNLIELLNWLAESSEKVNDVFPKDAPKNWEMIDYKTQEQLINSCAKETTRLIMEELGDDYFVVLVYESIDVYHQEQLALCLRYVDKKGRVVERFLGIVEVEDTASLTLKTTIENMLVDHSLSFDMVRGMGYDGYSNMKGYANGLKKLIMDGYPSSYYVPWFAHQLQLTIVAIAKQNDNCGWYFYQLEYVLNVFEMSCEKIGMPQAAQAKYIIDALGLNQIESDKGLNQEMSLGMPCHTRRESQHKTVMQIISLYPSILQILIKIGEGHNRAEAIAAHTVLFSFESFEFAFMAHLLLRIFEYTDDLCSALQKQDQDIVNAIDLVHLTKKQLQLLREDNGWECFLKEVTSFCVKHEIEVVDMDGLYEPLGRSPIFFKNVRNLRRFHVDIFLDVIDRQLGELNDMFDEVNTELLICLASFNPVDSFAAYDKDKLVTLAHFYPKDFSKIELLHLPYQLTMFGADMRKNERFREVKNLAQLSIKLVETKKHLTYELVYKLLKLVLLLPVATACVEKVYSPMDYVNNMVRSKTSEQCLNDCLVTFLEQEIFLQVKDDAIISCFHAMHGKAVL